MRFIHYSATSNENTQTFQVEIIVIQHQISHNFLKINMQMQDERIKNQIFMS